MQDHSTLYIFHRSGTWNDQFGECYTIFADNGKRLAHGLGRQKNLALQLEIEQASEAILLKSQLRKTFPFSGKIDVLDSEESTRSIVTRKLQVLAPEETELLSLKDPTTWKENLAESFIEAIGNALLDGGNDAHSGSSEKKFLVLHQNTPCGALTRERLPFFPESARKPGFAKKIANKLLPKRFSENAPPFAWCLRYSPPDELKITEPVLLSSIATLLELIRWSK